MGFTLTHIYLALAAFVVTFLVTPIAKRLAIKFDAVDYPAARRINKRPVPRMGGIAIFAGLAAALIVQYVGTTWFGWAPVLISHPSMNINYTGLAVATGIVFLTGAVDDIAQLSPKAKLLGQVLGAAVAVASGLVIANIVNPLIPGGEISLGWLAYPLTVFYLVAFSNIINLIDGLDGLATGISAIAAFSMYNYALLFGRVDAAALSIALAAACLAFLRYNFNPASIFLGDSGSLMLGFLLGVVSLLNVSRTAALTSLLVPLIVAGVPIIDTFSAIVRRRRAHVGMDVADKGHIHHRLIQEGYNQKQAVLLIYAWCILLAVGASVITQVSVAVRVVIFILLALLSFAVAMHLHLFEPVLRHHYNPKTRRDEIVTPDDPAFAEEERAAHEAHERRKHELLEKLADEHTGPAGGSADDPADAPQGKHFKPRG